MHSLKSRTFRRPLIGLDRGTANVSPAAAVVVLVTLVVASFPALPMPMSLSMSLLSLSMADGHARGSDTIIICCFIAVVSRLCRLPEQWAQIVICMRAGLGSGVDYKDGERNDDFVVRHTVEDCIMNITKLLIVTGMNGVLPFDPQFFIRNSYMMFE